MRMVNVLVSTVVDAIVAPPEAIDTVTPPTERLDVLAESVTSLKLVAADAASGSSNATTDTEAVVKNFLMESAS